MTKPDQADEKKHIWSASEAAGVIAVIVALSYIYGLSQIAAFLNILSLGWAIIQIDTTTFALVGGLSLLLYFGAVIYGVYVFSVFEEYKTIQKINFFLLTISLLTIVLAATAQGIDSKKYYSFITNYRIWSSGIPLAILGMNTSSAFQVLIKEKRKKATSILSLLAVVSFLIYGGAVNQGQILAYNAIILGDEFLPKIAEGENKGWQLALVLGENGAFILPDAASKTIKTKIIKMDGLSLTASTSGKKIPPDILWHGTKENSSPAINASEPRHSSNIGQ